MIVTIVGIVITTRDRFMKIIEHPESFKEGIRILMLTLRSKEGGKTNLPDRSAKKMISRNPEEFDKCMQILMDRRVGMERIYSTVDERDIDNAIRIFKGRQLDADYFDRESHVSFYVDIWNRWISSLQSPRARKGCLFMVDVDDDKQEEDNIRKSIEAHGFNLIHEYPTKNGRHFILEPFNPNLVEFDCLKNHMMLWVYEEESQ